MSHYISLPEKPAHLYDGNLVGKEVVLNHHILTRDVAGLLRQHNFILHDVFTILADATDLGQRFVVLRNDAGAKALCNASRFMVLDP